MEKQIKYKGVSLHRASGKYSSRINIKGKSIYLGLFNTAKEASEAYNIKKTTSSMDNVYYCKRDSLYTAKITHNGKRVVVGSFKTALEASNAVDKEKERLFKSSQDIQN